MHSTEIETVDPSIYAAADEAYDALRAASLRVPGLITAAIERGDRSAASELATRLRTIEKSSARLRGLLHPTAIVAEPAAPTVEEWT